MNKKLSEELIVKFITNHANQEEIELLTLWLQDTENHKLFETFIKTNYAIEYTMSRFDKKETEKQLLLKIKKEKNIFYKIKTQSFVKYAALLIIALGLGLGYLIQSSPLIPRSENLLITKDDAITLELDNGKVQTINTSNSIDILDKFGKVIGNQNKSKIIYSSKLSTNKIIYNTIRIPYGKHFELKLSDGTIVHLNSGTSLRYPIQFLKNQSRNVFLKGEAFFEVAKDKSHPFQVHTKDMRVEVLGTKFNINSYVEENFSDVVLVEGKVVLSQNMTTTQNPIFLTPGFKGAIKNGQQHFSKEKVNTDNYTAWINGSLVFKNMSFNSIIKILERRYNITFVNKNRTLGNEIFSARFDNEPIEAVLKHLSDSYEIKYTIKENKIIIE